MPSSYTPSLRLTLPVTGELAGTWGDTVNTGITNLVDASVAGTAAVTMTDADYTLTSVNGATDEARKMFVTLTGTLTAARNVICPTASKLYFIKNTTTGGFAVTLKTSAGTGISVPNGKSMVLYCDATNVVDATNHYSSLTLAAALPVLSGGTGVTTSTGTGSVVLNTSPTFVTPVLGTPTSVTLTNATGLPLTTGVTGILPTTNGGTGLSSFTAGDLPYYASGTALSKLGIGTAGQVLTSSGTAPQWSTLSGVAVTTFSAGTTGFTPSTATSGAITLAGTLATTNGGTGLTSFTANGILYASSTSVLTTGSGLTYNGTTLATTGALQVDGNATLGNASTDTVQVNGYMGVGGAGVSGTGIYERHSALTGVSQYGVAAYPTSTSAATTKIVAFGSGQTTAAAAFTVTDSIGFEVANILKGAGSTITNTHGVRIDDQTQGTNNYGITSLVSSGANKWNLYASGTANNYFAGSVGIGTASPGAKLQVGATTDTGGVSAVIRTTTTNLLVGQSGGSAFGFASGAASLVYEQANTLVIGTNAATPLVFGTNGTERMRLSAAGGLSIGDTTDPGAGSLRVAGNTTLGDATTDTVTVNGYMGVGGVATASASVYARSTALGGSTQSGFYSSITANSAATANVLGFYAAVNTEATAFTAANVAGFRVDSAIKGAGSTITNQYGLYVSDLTSGTNNYGVYSNVSSGTDKWNLYASGAARNYMAGALSIGATTDPGTGGLYVAGNTTLGDATTDRVTVTGFMSVGGTADPERALYIRSTDLTGASQRGIQVSATASAAATGTYYAVQSVPATAAAAFTISSVIGIGAANATKGAGSTITDLHGVYVADQTTGTNNYGVTSLVSSGTNKWNIYASGTAPNHLNGSLTVGTATVDTKLTVTGDSTFGFSASSGYTAINFIGSGTGSARYASIRKNYDSPFDLRIRASNATTDVPLVFETSSANERMRIDTSGNLGIGTGSPLTRLDVRNTGTSTTAGFVLGASDSGGNSVRFLATQNADGSITLNSNAANNGTASDIIFTQGATGGTERMRISSLGRVGIGTSSPSSTLSVTGSFDVTGNTILGDASTDTVTVNGYAGIGGNGAANVGLYVRNSALTAATQIGVQSEIVASSAATSNIRSFASFPSTAAAAFTVSNMSGVYLGDATKGAGSTITNQHGVYIVDQTQATNNYGVTSLVSSGSNKWNIYASGTANNYFAGNVGIGITTPGSLLHLNAAGGGDVPRLRFTNSSTGTGATDGSFVGISNSTQLDIWNLESSDVRFGTNNAERMRLDSSGNLGLGVTPSAWGTALSYRSLDIGPGSSFVNMGSNTDTRVASNGYYNGTNWIYKNTAAASYYKQALGAHDWSIAPSGTAGTAITFTQAMTLDASGNLGLGVTPSAWAFYTALQMPGGAISGLAGSQRFEMLQNAYYGTASSYYYTTTAAATGYRQSAGQHLWFNAASGTAGNAITFTQAMTLDAGGILLLGTTSFVGGSNDRMHVTTATASARACAFRNSTATTDTIAAWNSATSGDNQFIQFYTEATATSRGSITYNRAGGLVAYNTTSDYRAKTILGSVQNSGATIDALKVYEGQMKGATQSRPMLVAHEAQAVTPYAVTGEKDAVNDDGTPNYQQMDVSSLVPLLIAEIQSLRARVAQLESKP